MAANSFPLLAAPLFILMGNLMNSAGITVPHLRLRQGGASAGCAAACATPTSSARVIFAGMSGSAVADAAGLGTVEIEAMKKEGYDAETAGAITAASATIGPIIPPSLPMIVYGVAAETSIGALFLAGVIPGLLMAVALMVMVRHLAIRRQPAAPSVRGRACAVDRVPARVLGADGAGGAVRRPAVRHLHADRGGGGRGRSTRWCSDSSSTAISRFADLPKLILDTVETTGVVMALVMTASLLGYCISVSRLPQVFGADADRADDESARLPADRQRAAAGRRLLHGGAGGDAGADPDPRAAGAGAGHRPGAVRPRLRAEPDDRHDHAAGGRRALRHRQGRGRAVRARSSRATLPYPGAAVRGAGDDHALAAADDLAARRCCSGAEVACVAAGEAWSGRRGEACGAESGTDRLVMVPTR